MIMIIKIRHFINMQNNAQKDLQWLAHVDTTSPRIPVH